MKTYDFVVRRHGEPEDTASALVTVTTALPFGRIFAAVTEAVTRWVQETPEGKDAWEESSEDFNVGDLSGYLDSPVLRAYLRGSGIEAIAIDIDEPEEHPTWNYDTVLVDEPTDKDS